MNGDDMTKSLLQVLPKVLYANITELNQYEYESGAGSRLGQL